jgi:MFS family permease
LPNILVGLFAGTWADRARRRPIMIAANLARAILLLSIPFATFFGLLTIWQLYAVLFLSGICTTFFDVANVSYLPLRTLNSIAVQEQSPATITNDGS